MKSEIEITKKIVEVKRKYDKETNKTTKALYRIELNALEWCLFEY